MNWRAGSPPLCFSFLYALIYAGFGTASPFWPTFLESRGMAPEQLGVLFSATTMIRLAATPVAGRVADLLQALGAVLATCCLAAALAVLGFLPIHDFGVILLVGLAHAALLAPIAPMADALALQAIRTGSQGFEYGWIRGIGSAAFIVGTLLAGQMVAVAGMSIIVVAQAAFLGAAAMAALFARKQAGERDLASMVQPAAELFPGRGVGALLRIPLFRRVVLVASLVFGSHAMHDAFAMIRWRASGIDPTTASFLWSESVAAEVVVFLVLGPFLLRRLTPARAATLAAVAAVARWSVMALSNEMMAFSLVQPLHGLTFALLHLACMRLLKEIVPPELAATAQAIYAVSAGLMTAILGLVSGVLYEHFGAHGFWLSALICALALPAARRLRVDERA